MDGQKEHHHHSARVASHVPGRVRIRLHRESRHAPFMEQLKGKLEAVDGIHDVEVNSTTGSVRVSYNPQRHDASGIYQLLEDLDVVVGGFMGEAEINDAAPAPGDGQQSASPFMNAVEDLNRWLAAGAGVSIDLKIAAPLAFLGLGIWSIARNGFMTAKIPGWLFLWLAFDTFVKLHPTHPHPTPAAP